ncbi:hypothetical protein B296_00051541, partial [Ensete ventricosum]
RQKDFGSSMDSSKYPFLHVSYLDPLGTDVSGRSSLPCNFIFIWKYLPNELRGGMISSSLAPANAAILLFLLKGGYHQNLANSTIMALSAFGLIIAAGCIYKLRSWRKQCHEDWHYT